jgi:hypothetical protein
MSRPRLIALLLAMLTLAVYLPVVRNGFIIYDDGDYVTQNRMVQGGLTMAGIKWAFTTFKSANWHPLTWLSHMTDAELFGVNAAGSHFVNVLFHAANTVLLFGLWMRLMRRPNSPASRTRFGRGRLSLRCLRCIRCMWNPLPGRRNARTC